MHVVLIKIVHVFHIMFTDLHNIVTYVITLKNLCVSVTAVFRSPGCRSLLQLPTNRMPYEFHLCSMSHRQHLKVFSVKLGGEIWIFFFCVSEYAGILKFTLCYDYCLYDMKFYICFS